MSGHMWLLTMGCAAWPQPRRRARLALRCCSTWRWGGCCPRAAAAGPPSSRCAAAAASQCAVFSSIGHRIAVCSIGRGTLWSAAHRRSTGSNAAALFAIRWRSTGWSCSAARTCCMPQEAEKLTPVYAVRQVLLFAAIAATVVTTIFMEQVRDT